MPAPLLTTKLYIPPPRPNWVPRPRLIQWLDDGLCLGHRLTLISAPAGFGKTTLLSEWIQQSERPTAWLSLDEGDNDPVRFLAYLIGALQRVDEAIGHSLQGILQSSQLPSAASASRSETTWIEGLMTALINAVTAVAAKTTLVLDDYHLIHAASIHQAIRFLLEHQPPLMHVVISTREDPPLPLPRLRARGQVTEIRERELRFTVEEATAFFNRTMGLHLSPDAVTALETRTEGWIAGLQLAALSLQDRDDADAFITAFAGDDRHVMGYLVEEVLHRQPEEVQRFLLHTAILERLSGPLCDAVLSRGIEEPFGYAQDRHGSRVDLPASPFTSSQEMLEYLEQSNLFIVPLDSKREWYRYHRLFADLLRYRLRREQPERLADLHRRASQWYEQADDPDEAIHHALVIPDFSLAAHLAEQYGLRLVRSSRLATYLSWVRPIPDDVIYTRPYLCAGCGWAFVLTGQVEAAERYVEAGEAALSDFERVYAAPEGRFITWEEVHGQLTAIRAYCARLRGDIPGVIEHSQQALAQLPADAFTVRCVVALNLGLLHFYSGKLDAAQAAFAEAFEMALKSEENMFVAVSALSLQGDILAFQGELRAAVERYHRVIALGTEGTGIPFPIPAVGMGHLGLAMAHYQRYEMATAAHHLEKGAALARQAGNSEAVVGIYLAQVQFAVAAGDLALAEVLLDQAGELVRPYRTTSHFYTNWIAIRAGLHLAQGDVKAAAQEVAALDLQVTDLTPQDLTAGSCRPRLPEYLLLPRVLLAQGRLDETVDVLERLASAAEACQYAAVFIEATILQTLAWHLKRDNIRAMEYLERAVALAAPEGYVRPFLDAGEPMRTLLRQAVARGVQTEYAQKLLALFVVQARRDGASPLSPDTATAPLYEPLTERERQVLRLLAVGLSSTEVADELVLAVSTVRSYIKTIYRKMDVHDR
ncbi:MAG: LuxR C-terminal-related transcriptional regulator, partial [Anaerolineae bacterium]